jgi:hypothetical protein
VPHRVRLVLDVDVEALSADPVANVKVEERR